MIEFTCNLCGRPNRTEKAALGREASSCSSCGSNVRARALMQALSQELFGANLALPDFPRLKSLRGMGTSDSIHYCDRLAAKFDYRNTFYDREPRFDITSPAPAEEGRYDFLISSEVLEHVLPPPAAAFQGACRVLKPAGILLLTVPYSLELSTAEHFPELHEFGLARLGDRTVLVNRTREGAIQVFENLIFHRDGSGSALEMREYSEAGIMQLLTDAGFQSIRVYGEEYLPFGIVHQEACSLPMTASKAPFALGREATRELAQQYRDLQCQIKRLSRKFWFRLGYRLGLL